MIIHSHIIVSIVTIVRIVIMLVFVTIPCHFCNSNKQHLMTLKLDQDQLMDLSMVICGFVAEMSQCGCQQQGPDGGPKSPDNLDGMGAISGDLESLTAEKWRKNERER